MTTGSIARRYARALYELGQDKGSPLGLIRNVQSMAEVWTDSEELRDLIANPHLKRDTRRRVLNEIAARLALAPYAKNFVNLLFDKSRLVELPAIAMELGKLADERQNRVRAEVISATPLPEVTLSKLKFALEKATGRVVMISAEEDPSLIGGVVTRVGDMMYDGSIRRQLTRMKETILGHN